MRDYLDDDGYTHRQQELIRRGQTDASEIQRHMAELVRLRDAEIERLRVENRELKAELRSCRSVDKDSHGTLDLSWPS